VARIVFTTWGSLGDLHPYLAVGVDLQRRGHDVAIATVPTWRANVIAAGLEFRQMRPDVSPEDPRSRDLVRRILDAREGPAFLFTEMFAPRIREIYDDTVAALRGADLVVSHQIPVTTPIVVEQTGVTWVSAVLLPMGFLSAYDPPTAPQAPWLRTVAGMHPTLGGAVNWIGRQVTRPWVEHVYRLREELGLERGGNPVFEAQHSPALVLGLFSTVLAKKQPDYPPQTLITGFPFYDTHPAHAVDPRIAAFLDAGEPPIVFTLGSSAVWIADDFYPVSVEAVTRLGRRALLLVGEHADALRATLPAGITAFDYAPHGLVMPRASVVVHQGGVGTTGQALRSGRPMLVVPFGQDQPDNARRCVALGVARTIARGHYTVDRVASELAVLLSTPSYAARAAVVGEQVREERGAETAADAIERVLGGRGGDAAAAFQQG
jgi:UDP:flavonoid glycosyltransferase YjiC (YdhE family)